MHSVGHLRKTSANLVNAPWRLKWINLSHIDPNFPFNTCIVVELRIKIIILQNAIDLRAVFS